MSSLDKTSELVLAILKTNKRAREDDFVLYGAVIKHKGVNLKTTSLYDFLATAKEKGMPAFASVTKCRRTLQGRYPELTVEETVKIRNDAQSEYMYYNNKIM